MNVYDWGLDKKIKRSRVLRKLDKGSKSWYKASCKPAKPETGLSYVAGARYCRTRRTHLDVTLVQSVVLTDV